MFLQRSHAKWIAFSNFCRIFNTDLYLIYVLYSSHWKSLSCYLLALVLSRMPIFRITTSFLCIVRKTVLHSFVYHSENHILFCLIVNYFELCSNAYLQYQLQFEKFFRCSISHSCFQIKVQSLWNFCKTFFAMTWKVAIRATKMLMHEMYDESSPKKYAMRQSKFRSIAKVALRKLECK